MKIVVAANAKMASYATFCIRSIEKLGYPVVIYDLGGLGFGKPFLIDNSTFQQQGYYHKITKYRSAVGEHKPALIEDCLRFCDDLLVHMDADTLMIGKIDEMQGDYDVGLTVRPPWEMEKLVLPFKQGQNFIYHGYINTGVMCFNPTVHAFRFLKKWQEICKDIRDEQGAINHMLKEYYPLKPQTTIEVDGIKIRLFDALRYNHYHFFTSKNCQAYPLVKDDLKINWDEVKILHFKGEMREHHPRSPSYNRTLYFLLRITDSFLFYFDRLIINFRNWISNCRGWIINFRYKTVSIPYIWALNYWKRICRQFPQIKSLYLRNSMVQGTWVPGSSDIDMTIVIDKDLSADQELLFLKSFWNKYHLSQKIFPMLGEIEVFDEEGIRIWSRFGIRGYESRDWKLLIGQETVQKDYRVEFDALAQESLDYALHVFKSFFLKKLFTEDMSSLTLQRLTKKILRYATCNQHQDIIKGIDFDSREDMLYNLLKELEKRIAVFHKTSSFKMPSSDDAPVESVISFPKGVFRPAKEPNILIVIKDGLDYRTFKDCIRTLLNEYKEPQKPAVLSLSILDYILRVQAAPSYYEFMEDGKLISGKDLLEQMKPTEEAFRKGMINRAVQTLNFSRREEFLFSSPKRLKNSFMVQEILNSKLFLEQNEALWSRPKLMERYKEKVLPLEQETIGQDCFVLFKGLTNDIARSLKQF